MGACSEQQAGTPPLAERGRQIYLSQCTACHAMDPAQTGPVGPPIKGSSRELLDAKLVRGGYPEGYRPKRVSRVMTPAPALATDIPALVEFLRQ
ncbi:MAG: c-type cytochrome [Candidatus Rokuibacteriota bacterium]